MLFKVVKNCLGNSTKIVEDVVELAIAIHQLIANNAYMGRRIFNGAQISFEDKASSETSD